MGYKLILTLLVFIGVAVAYARYRNDIGQEMLVALLFALFVTSYNPYEYETANVFIGHINTYPLVLWTGGLVLLREVYERMNVPYRWLLTSALYLIVLFIIEYVGYYWLQIRTVPALPSLWELGIIHGTVFLQAFYLLAGPLYLLATDYLRVR